MGIQEIQDQVLDRLVLDCTISPTAVEVLRMKATVGLVLLSALLLAPRVNAGSINNSRESWEGHCDYRTQYIQPCVPISLPLESASIQKTVLDFSADNSVPKTVLDFFADDSASTHSVHCNWISASGTTCSGGSGAPIQILQASTPNVNPTPEPAPVLLFGTMILGALVLTKVRG
jgi:hypothetical protein